MKICLTCRGRGEVAAGITFGAVEYGPTYLDYDGEPLRACFPTEVMKNPKAMCKIKTGNPKTDYDDVWIIKREAIIPAWDIAICGTCRGAGIVLMSNE